MAYLDENGNIDVCSLSESAALHKSGKLQDYSYVFNNLIQDTNQMPLSWKIPFKGQWFCSV